MVSLAVRNARRNWSRSVLAIAGMALAAGILTAAHSVTSGYFSSGYMMVRTFMAGDIVVLPGHVYLDPGQVPRGIDLTWRALDQPYLNDLADLHPHILTDGYVMPEGAETAIDLDRLPAELTGHPQVAAVTPYYSLPGYVEPGHYAPLRGRDIAGDLEAWRWDEAIVNGRYFTRQDDGAMVAVVAAPAAGTGISAIPPAYRTPAVGERLKISVPRLAGFSGGLPIFDYLEFEQVELEVIGHFQLKVGTVQEMRDGEPVAVDVYWNTPQVLIPSGAFREIYRQVSGLDPGMVHQLSVRVDRFYDAGRVAAELRQQLRGWTVMAVPEIMELSGRSRGQGAVPRDLAGPLTAAAYGIAGMLVVTNMYLVNVQRRRELGIMKAVGASSVNIMALVLVEYVGYALVGAAAGFGAVRLLAAVIMLMADVSLWEAGLSTAALGVRVAAVTGLTSVLFGLVPAYEAATTPTMEVLRDE